MSVISTRTAITPSPAPTNLPLNTAAPVAEPTIRQSLEDAERVYVSRISASKAAHEDALEFLPGGNTRSVLFNRPFPLCMKRGSGNRLWDVDDHEYVYMTSVYLEDNC